jgi:GcrA cell cycle regulator
MSGWTDARIDRLKTLYAEGLSFSQIARALGGVTRNGCIGKAHRIGLEPRAKASVPKVPRVPKAPRTAHQATGRPLPPARAPVFVEGRTVPGDAIGCQFPPGEPGAGMCGAPRLLKATPGGGARPSSYCPTHNALCIAPSKPYLPRTHIGRARRSAWDL